MSILKFLAAGSLWDSMDDAMKLALMIPTSVDIRNVIGQLIKCAVCFFNRYFILKAFPLRLPSVQSLLDGLAT